MAIDIHTLVIALIKKSAKHTHFGRFPCAVNLSLGDHLFPLNFESVLDESFTKFKFGTADK